MNHTIEDLIAAVKLNLQGIAPNLDIAGFTSAIAYPPLSTTLELDGIPLDPFIRPAMGINAYEAADVYEDFINHYILGNDTPPMSPRDYLIRELDLTKSDGKWLFPKVKEQGGPIELALFCLVRLAWAIGKKSGNSIQISDDSLIIDGLPSVGILMGGIKSVWFAGYLPNITFNVARLIYTASETPRLRLRGDALIRAYHNAGSLELGQWARVRMALRILAAGYKQKVNLALELDSGVRKPVGKAFRKNLRRVAGEIRGFPCNPAHYIVRELVNTEVIDREQLFDALPGLRNHLAIAEGWGIDREAIKTWSRELRKLGG